MSTRTRAILSVGVIAVIATGAYFGRAHLHRVPLVGRLLPAPAPAQVWVCPMHPEVRRPGPGSCPKCGMDLVRETPPSGAPDGASADRARAAAPAGTATPASSADTSEPRAGLSLDLRRQQLIGVRLATVTRQPIARTVRAVGLVKYDERRLADVNVKLDGWIEDLYVDTTGQPVRKGQRLFSLYSPDLVATQQEYVLALKTREQVQASQVSEARGYADRLVAAARQRLASWDVPADVIAALERTRDPQKQLVVPSPVSGYVIEKAALEGMRVTAGQSLYKVADVSVVWVEADVFERELPFVKAGMGARVTLDALPGEALRGRITYVYPFVDEQTRTVRVRVELANRGGRLKPGMYANVQLELESGRGTGLTVPTDAVIDTGRAQFVFVSQGDGYFEPRRVETGLRLPDAIEIVRGLTEGQLVASGATFFLDSESQLRAAMEGYEAAPELDAGKSGEGRAAGIDVTFVTRPDPPRNGDNAFEVRLRDGSGHPVTDAEVSVRLYMAPMPSMNMPAMRAEARLLHVGEGLYRGDGRITMSGRWDVTVVATRDGRRIATRQFAVVAQ